MLQKSLIALALGAAFGGTMDEATEQGQTGGAPAAKKERKVEKVKMGDGRELEFVGNRKMQKESIIDGSKVMVRLDFRNGNTVNFPIPDSLLLKAAGHGIEQKLGDEAAGEEDVDDMQLAIEELAKRLTEQGLAGWTTKREGGGFGGASLLVKALVEVTGQPLEEVKSFLKAKVDAGTTYAKLNDAFSEDADVGPILKRLRKEKAGEAGVDTKSLLGSLKAAVPAAPAAA